MSTADEQLSRIATSGIRRPIYTWTIPEEARLFSTDPASFTMTPYTVADEIDAIKIAKVTGNLQYEFIKKAVVQLNGQPVSDPDWLEKTSPPTRRLFSDALDDMLLPSDKTMSDFKNSRQRGSAG
jgi:hypothetical protein